MNKKSLALLLMMLMVSTSIILFSSCNKQGNNNHVITIDVSATKDLNLKDLIKSIHIIPLETRDSCLVEEHHKLQIKNGLIYITNEQNEVLQFSAEGKFLRSTLPHRGQRTDEYIIAYSSYVDEDENLEIYEMFIPRIQKFTNEFDFIETIPVEVPNTLSSLRARTHVKLNDSIYIFKDIYDIHFYSTTQKQVVRTIHEKFPPLLGQTTHLMLENYDNRWHYSRSYSCDTLFYLDETSLELKPEIIFDFGGNSFNVNDLPADMTPQYYQKYLVETDKILVLEKINLADKQLCFFIKGDKSYVSCTTNKGTTVYLQNKGNLLPTPQAIENKTFYNLVWPEDLEKYIHTELMDEESVKRMQHIKDDDNPVLLCYKVR